MTTERPPGVSNLEKWRFRITGAVDRPVRFSREELLSLPLTTVDETIIEAVSWLPNDHVWRGVRGGTLLDKAHPRSGSRFSLVHATDGDYACAFALGRLREAIFAVERDGEPVSIEDGGPVRLLPGTADADCWETIKWVSEVEVTATKPTDRDTARDLVLAESS